MARFNLAWLFEPVLPDLVLGRRARYGFSDSDVYESSENAEFFESIDPKFEKRRGGYKLKSGSDKGFVRTHALVLPSGDMKVSCQATNGRLIVVLMDESDAKLRDSHWIIGAQIDEPNSPGRTGPSTSGSASSSTSSFCSRETQRSSASASTTFRPRARPRARSTRRRGSVPPMMTLSCRRETTTWSGRSRRS